MHERTQEEALAYFAGRGLALGSDPASFRKDYDPKKEAGALDAIKAEKKKAKGTKKA